MSHVWPLKSFELPCQAETTTPVSGSRKCSKTARVWKNVLVEQNPPSTPLPINSIFIARTICMRTRASAYARTHIHTFTPVVRKWKYNELHNKWISIRSDLGWSCACVCVCVANDTHIALFWMMSIFYDNQRMMTSSIACNRIETLL